MEPQTRSLQNNLNSLSSQMRNILSQMKQMNVRMRNELSQVEKLEKAAARRKEDLDDLKEKYGALDRRRKSIQDNINKVKEAMNRISRKEPTNEV